MTLVHLKSINKIYQTGDVAFPALKDINLQINQGEFIAIVGPSGCGKSTLMNILGLLDQPSKGSYHLNNQDVSRLSDDHLAMIRNKTIGFVFQSFNLLPRTSALENVALPLIYSGIPREDRLEKAAQLLKQIGLADKLNSHPNQLSGGQQQRVAIARSLVTNPEIILADEPTGNLDSASGKTIIQIFKDLHKAGKTIVLITHDSSIARSAARIIRMKDGKIKK